MDIYIKELQCDWDMGRNNFCSNDQITVELIEAIKKSIMDDSKDGPYNIYAAHNDGNWLQMYFRMGLAAIDIICEPNHEYVYYDKKYEGQTDLECSSLQIALSGFPSNIRCNSRLRHAENSGYKAGSSMVLPIRR